MTKLSREELLVVLIEECGEVIQAATKCLRFGFDSAEPGYGINHIELAKEIGDVCGVADGFADQYFSMMDMDALAETRAGKFDKVARVNAEVLARVKGALKEELR